MCIKSSDTELGGAMCIKSSDTELGGAMCIKSSDHRAEVVPCASRALIQS